MKLDMSLPNIVILLQRLLVPGELAALFKSFLVRWPYVDCVEETFNARCRSIRFESMYQ
jgi:hypothetical protein